MMPSLSTLRNSLRSVTTWDVVRLAAGFLLGVAAILKSRQLAWAEVEGDAWWDVRAIQIPFVLGELALALWLLTGLHARVTRLAALLFFVLLLEVSLYQAVTAKSSCQCFGALDVNPWLTFTVDLSMVIFLLASPPKRTQDQAVTAAPQRLLAFLAAFLLLALPGTFFMLHYSPAGVTPSLRADPDLRARFRLELNEPNTADILYQLNRATGLRFALDGDLETASIEYGRIQMSAVPAWAVMELVVQKQDEPVRWEKTGSGYHLIRMPHAAARQAFWWGAGILLLLFPVAIWITERCSEARPAVDKPAMSLS